MDLILDCNGNELHFEAVHPGEFLMEEIQERKLLKKDVAKALGIHPHHLSEVFAGKRNISPRMAIKLEKLLGVSANYWANLQLSYDLSQARVLENAQ